ncbi:hypothetical protein SARC_09854 [Sphaeroforma arctica JP610]|uniref:Uncharacterized protein n=1 Tax=Sphaeroforma arctica JP610 TaxID=667725 RepID=A0A0L0FLN8_9EUKA|nr:hypothetical protein SARC_09854 [Sphaeroforma arctica JP610]KNC77692.1 hypothetical protein SARC_09854 [Sphaeroforma arctica JP610]|eukprot:XP_014151594.1 hypothetical protein SARC_09854 [Sphaeroforma arctica JP610]
MLGSLCLPWHMISHRINEGAGNGIHVACLLTVEAPLVRSVTTVIRVTKTMIVADRMAGIVAVIQMIMVVRVAGTVGSVHRIVAIKSVTTIGTDTPVDSSLMTLVNPRVLVHLARMYPHVPNVNCAIGTNHARFAILANNLNTILISARR